MAITQNANRVRLESAAKTGTLGDQSGLAADQIKFDTAITTNNGNLEASPSFRQRHLTIRRGLSTEDCGIIKSVDVDGLTCTMQSAWDDPPVDGDSYDVAYRLVDVATVDGCDFETDSRQWTLPVKRLVVGALGLPGYLGMSQGEILRCADRGATEAGLDVGADGRFEIGTIRNDVANLGAVVIFTHDQDNDLCFEAASGSVLRLFEFTLISARAPEGVNSLDVGLTGADIQWARGQLYGIDAPKFKKRVARYKDVLGELVLSRADVVASPMWNGWLKSPFDQTLRDELGAEADAAQIRILIEG